MFIGVSKNDVWLFVSFVSVFGPEMDWWPVQAVPCLSPDDCWDRLQLPRDPTNGFPVEFTVIPGKKVANKVLESVVNYF